MAFSAPPPRDGRERTGLWCRLLAAQGSEPARRPEKKHECQIRWARGNQSGCTGAAKHWADGARAPARAVQVWITLKMHVQ